MNLPPGCTLADLEGGRLPSIGDVEKYECTCGAMCNVDAATELEYEFERCGDCLPAFLDIEVSRLQGVERRYNQLTAAISEQMEKAAA